MRFAFLTLSSYLLITTSALASVVGLSFTYMGRSPDDVEFSRHTEDSAIMILTNTCDSCVLISGADSTRRAFVDELSSGLSRCGAGGTFVLALNAHGTYRRGTGWTQLSDDKIGSTSIACLIYRNAPTNSTVVLIISGCHGDGLVDIPLVLAHRPDLKICLLASSDRHCDSIGSVSAGDYVLRFISEAVSEMASGRKMSYIDVAEHAKSESRKLNPHCRPSFWTSRNFPIDSPFIAMPSKSNIISVKAKSVNLENDN